MFLTLPRTLLKFFSWPKFMRAVGISTWFQFTQWRCLFCHQEQKEWQNSLWLLFCRWFGYYFALVWKIGTTSHVNVAVYLTQILKTFAQVMSNFSALGMQPHPIPYAYVRGASVSIFGGQSCVYTSLISTNTKRQNVPEKISSNLAGVRATPLASQM